MSEARSTVRRAIPWAAVTACLLILSAAGLTVGGVYVLTGLGWALLAGAAPCAVLAWLILRGLS
jgi:hypothetical protein